jgi:hypothetical protein
VGEKGWGPSLKLLQLALELCATQVSDVETERILTVAALEFLASKRRSSG